MGENTVVFRKTGYGEPLDLVAVKLASGGTTRLPLPANRVLTGRIAMGTGNDALLVASFGSGDSNTPGKLDLLHYDLGTSMLVEASSLEHSTLSANDVRVLVQPDGGWRVVASSDGFYGFELVSGHDLRSPYDARVVIPSSLGISSASAIGADDGRIWFKPRSQDLPGVRAMMLAAGPTASTVVHATALPCSESDGVLRILFTASAAPAQDTTFQVRTAGGSATSPADFTAVDRAVTLPAGATEVIITLPVAQDTVLEPTEHLTLAIVDPGDHAVFLQDEVVAMIRGTSHDLLAPVAPRLPTGEGMPTRVYLAAETMIQFTAGTSWDVPATGDRLARRPFEGGEWSGSSNWGRPIVVNNDVRFRGRAGSLVLLRDNDELTLYDVASDQVLHRIPGMLTSASVEAVGAPRFFSNIGFSAPREYDLSPPFASRPITNPTLGSYHPAVYTTDLLLLVGGQGVIQKHSRADGSHLGNLLPSGPWSILSTVAAEGDRVAICDGGKLWLLSVDHPQDVIQVRHPTAAFGPDIAFSDGLLYSTRSNGISNLPVIDVIDPVAGVVVESISAGLRATVLEGSPVPPTGRNPGYYYQSFSVEGRKAVMLIYDGVSRIVRLSREGKLPSLNDPADVSETDGALSIQLAEAASFPITVTTRTVAAGANQEADWGGSGSTVVVPAGTTAFATGLSAVDDHISEGDHEVALELTLSGNGRTEVRRLPLRLKDNDRVQLADIPHSSPTLHRSFAAVGGGWASVGGTGLVWTGDPGFSAASPFTSGWTFGEPMAGSGEWLAAAHSTWGGTFGTANPSSIILYKPALQSAPARILKGLKVNNFFGSALLARGDTLWVGAPGRYDTNGNKTIDVKGQAFEYHMPTGKRVRTFKPPKQHARGFGYEIAANDSSVWFSSFDRATQASAVSQYSRATGKWLRTLPEPVARTGQAFGGQLAASPDTLIATFQGKVHGFSAATGAPAWTITPPDSQAFGTVEMIRDDLFVAGGNTLFFYQLVPGSEPVMRVEVRIFGWPMAKLEANGSQLMVYRNNFGSSEQWTLIDLAGIPQLASFFPAAAGARAALTEPTEKASPPALVLVSGPDGWQLALPAAAEASRLECSTDLAGWTPFVVREGGMWRMLAGAGPAGADLISADTLRIPRDRPRMFFRLHTP
jgi:hypothetical protein